MINVQIVISGQYTENKGDADHPHWKCGGSHNEIMACNVPLIHAPDVIKEIEARMYEMSWSDEFSSCHFSNIWMAPNKLSSMDLINFEYKAYDEITSISKEELMAFLKAFGDEPEEELEKEGFESY